MTGKISSLFITLALLTTMPLLAQKDRLAGASLSDSMRIASLRKISRAYAEGEDYTSAVVFIRKAIDALTPLVRQSSADIGPLINDYFKLAEYYSLLGQAPAKMKVLDNMIALCREHRFVNLQYLYELWERTKYLFDSGDFALCSDYAALGEEDARKSLDKNHYYNAFLLHHVNAQLGLKHYDVAEALLHGQAEQARTAAPEFLWCLYIQMAQLEAVKENYGQAILYYNKAFQAARAIGEGIGCLQSLENIGFYVYFSGYGDGNKALTYYKQALAYAGKCHEPAPQIALESLNLLTNMANVYVRTGLYDSAIRYYQLAFDQLGQGMNEKKLSHSLLGSVVYYDRVWYLTALMLDRGDAWLQQYKTTHQYLDLRQAIDVYKAADKVLDKFKSEQADITSRLFWRSDSRRLYEHAIEASYLDNKNMADAFYFFEKSRSVLLNDQLSEQSAFSNNEIAQQAQWRKDIFSLKKQLDSPRIGADQHAALTTKLLKIRQQLDSMKAAAVRPPDTNFIRLEDVPGKLLTDDQALVELFAGDSSVYILLVAPGRQSLTRVDRARFDSAASLYVSYLSSHMAANRDIMGYRRTARQLYRLIFGSNPAPAGRIIISPDGQYFPFEALIAGKDSTAPPVYFIHDHAVSYTYSARYLLNDNHHPDPAPGSFMGIAPGRYASYLDLPSLPGSESSLDRIGCHFSKPTELVSAQASRNNFLTQFAKFRIIQLYTHAAAKAPRKGNL